tara:strand:- start:61 stop:477 length:417 start_codon:yes stop_codon:yes gene_type:complete
MFNKNKPFIDKLRSSGLRPTMQRVKISKFLFGRKKTFHFTVDDLNKLINSKKKGKKISLATLYNTVHALKSAGHLQEFSLENNISYYDTNVSSHHHFYDAGKLIDIKKKNINFKKLPLPPSGKRIKNVEVVIKLENVK